MTESDLAIFSSLFGKTGLAPPDFPVNFPDPNLEAVIREFIFKPAGEILYSDLQGISWLYASSKEIAAISALSPDWPISAGLTL